MTEQIDLDALEALAKAATPGPWNYRGTILGTQNTTVSAGDGVHIAYASVCHAMPENAGYIAAADPATVLGLIAELRQERERADEAIRDLDAGFSESDHLSAKYYQRMRDAEREMHARELHHFEEEQKSAVLEAALSRAEATIEKVHTILGGYLNPGGAVKTALRILSDYDKGANGG